LAFFKFGEGVTKAPIMNFQQMIENSNAHSGRRFVVETIELADVSIFFE
jgi:hypothetical protein